MLVQSAELAGLHVVQLVHENTAAATMFGIDRLDKDEDIYVLYYNMGGMDTEVSVVRYSAVSDARNKTSEYIEILGEGYDKTLGGIEFDHVLFNILADRFNALPARQGKPDVRENARAVKRLFKEANKIKDILSANKQTNVKIPELLDYVTLQFDLKRTEFEDAAAHLFERVAKPVE
jgi:hypoxia up-regulated 1